MRIKHGLTAVPLLFLLLTGLLAPTALLPRPADATPGPSDPKKSEADSEIDGTEESAEASGESELKLPISRVFVINIHDVIDDVQLESIKRRLEVARENDVELLIFDLDTPGGQLYSALEITELIFRIDDIPTVAYVSDMAISAGALIALSCDDLVMAPGTTIGDCEPIFQTAGGIETAPEKIQTVLRAKFRALAEKNGYPVLLAQAMVTKDLEIIEVRDPDTGEVQFVDSSQYIDRATRGLTATESDKDDDLQDRLARTPGEPLRVVIKKGELLTMTDSEALNFGFSRATVRSIEEAVALFAVPASSPVVLEFSWSEVFARKLQAIKWIFFILGVLGLYLEIKTPGFGLPGILSIISFAVYFASGYVGGLAESWEILLFFLGLVLIALEIFIIPGFGLPGIMGVLLVITGLFLSAIPFVPFKLPEQNGPAAYDFQLTMTKSFLLHFTGSVALVVLFAYLLSRLLPKTPYFNRLILQPAGPEGGTQKIDDASSRKSAVGNIGLGEVGEAITPLRPAGRVRFACGRADVVTEGGFIPKGEVVRVIEVAGNRIVVGRVSS